MSDLDPLAVEAAVQANQHANELSWIAGILRGRQLSRVLEIGCESGWSLWLWAQLATDDAALMGVDAEWLSTAFTSLIARHPWPARDNQTLKLHKGDSHAPEAIQAAREWATSPVDFLFLDADHSCEGVLLDWENFSPLVAEGGLVGFHDVANQASEGWTALKARGYRTDEFVNPDNGDMGIGVIYL